jgi:hypothetical protein
MGNLADKASELTQIVATVETAEQTRNDLRTQLAAAEQAHTEVRTQLENAYGELRLLIDAGNEYPPIHLSIPDGGIATVDVPEFASAEVAQ